MSTSRRKFSKEEKLSILKESSEHGVKVTLEKHGIYPATFYAWRKKFDSMGEESLDYGMTKPQQRRLRELEKGIQMAQRACC